MKRRLPTLNRQCRKAGSCVIPRTAHQDRVEYTLVKSWLTPRQRHYVISTLTRFGWVHQTQQRDSDNPSTLREASSKALVVAPQSRNPGRPTAETHAAAPFQQAA